MENNPLEQLSVNNPEKSFNTLDEAISELMGKDKFPAKRFDFELGQWFNNMKEKDAGDEEIKEILSEKLEKFGYLSMDNSKQDCDSKVSNKELTTKRFEIAEESHRLIQKINENKNNYSAPNNDKWENDLEEINNMIDSLETLFTKEDDNTAKESINKLKSFKAYIHEIKGIYENETDLLAA